jgi:hypothetical protein
LTFGLETIQSGWARFLIKIAFFHSTIWTQGSFMANVFTQYAEGLHGSGVDFEQTVYINSAGWGAADPKQRRGAQTSGTGHRGGVCMGVSLLYLACRGSWSVFKNTVITPGGLAFVRGVMNLSKEADRVGGYTSDDHRGQMMLEMGKTLGLTPARAVWKRGAQNLADNIMFSLRRETGLYHFNFWGGGNGHAVAFLALGGSYVMFDPNYGQAILGDEGYFSHFVQWVFPNLYPGMDQLALTLKFT